MPNQKFLVDSEPLPAAGVFAEAFFRSHKRLGEAAWCVARNCAWPGELGYVQRPRRLWPGALQTEPCDQMSAPFIRRFPKAATFRIHAYVFPTVHVPARPHVCEKVRMVSDSTCVCAFPVLCFQLVPFPI